jgi:hypothetical protein
MPRYSCPSKHPPSDRNLSEIHPVPIFMTLDSKLNFTALISSIPGCPTYEGIRQMLHPIAVPHTCQASPFNSPNIPDEDFKLKIK